MILGCNSCDHLCFQTDLILLMMAKDPNNRPTADDIVSMDIVSEKNKVMWLYKGGVKYWLTIVKIKC